MTMTAIGRVRTHFLSAWEGLIDWQDFRRLAFPRLAAKAAHWRRALAYARGTLTPKQAMWMIGDCEHAAGWYSLQCISVGGVLEAARYRWADHPALQGYAERAADRVAQKWSGNGDMESAAHDWAVDLIAGYAAADGVTLEDSEDWHS
ncbi:MAG: hypothetical protein KF723_22050 [Rhizobiaceae bacterium]|nr:hypothetical protein [Rhizobiaceae bacterium]